MASGTEHTAGEYIAHHLTHLRNMAQTELFQPGVVHFDTLAFSLLCAFVMLWFLRRGAKNATPGVPGKFQAFVEMLVEMVSEQAKGIVHNENSRRFVAPLALTAFCWIVLMNAIDLLPVDWFPTLAHAAGASSLRPLPTADLNATLGMSIGVLLLMLYYNLKIKGVGGWVHELFYAPFGNVHPGANPLTWLAFIALGLANFGINIIEFVAKTVSLGMRLFGNMYAGELIFFLIALLGGSATVFGFFGHVLAGSVWAVFHILIVLLQAFIFMMLTLVYIGQAHDSH